MATQLAFDFSNKPLVDNNPIITKDAWLDESQIARGVGFMETVLVSLALHDAIEYQRADYDQLLYDALWMAHFKFSLDSRPSATFNFITEGKGSGSGIATSIHLRLRVQSWEQTVCLGLLEDF
jgi:hypothetical protein